MFDGICLQRWSVWLNWMYFPSQKALALELGIARSTVSNFLNGKPVDFLNFTEICDKLCLDWQDISQIKEKKTEAERVIYIERPPIESICYKTILQPGSLIRIKAPKKMGKTFLTNRILEQSKKHGYQTSSINLLDADTNLFTDFDKFLRWFCSCIGRELNLPRENLTESWCEEDGSKTKCNIYFKEYLLPKIPEALVLCIDNIDLIFPHKIAEDFLGLLRSWHEKAKRENLWKKLRLVVVHSTEVYIPLDINKSPFNVGKPIELPEFNFEQVNKLTENYQLNWQAEKVKQLTYVVGGHPFLLDRALSYLATRQNLTLLELLEKAPTNEGIYRNHLQELLSILETNPELKAAFHQVVMATECVNLESLLTYKLDSLGLVKLVVNDVIPRCELYRQYFSDRL
ncbi:MAG: DNA-binding protein [Okeania sp. SIO2D1]|nr:DNA-binding protein [Okeania sp. SIO2D1]